MCEKYFCTFVLNSNIYLVSRLKVTYVSKSYLRQQHTTKTDLINLHVLKHKIWWCKVEGAGTHSVQYHEGAMYQKRHFVLLTVDLNTFMMALA